MVFASIDAEIEDERIVWKKIRKAYKRRRNGYKRRTFDDKGEKRAVVFRAFSSEPNSDNVMDIYTEYKLSGPYMREEDDDTVYHCACSQTGIHSWYFARNQVNGNTLRVGGECYENVIEEQLNDRSLPGFVVADNVVEHEEKEEEKDDEESSISDKEGSSSESEDSFVEPEPDKSYSSVSTRSQNKRKLVEEDLSPPRKKRILLTSDSEDDIPTLTTSNNNSIQVS